MIDVKQIAKPKSGSGSTSVRTTIVNTTVTESQHSARSDKADYADKATYADKAGYSSRAAYADKAGNLDAGSPVYDQFLRKDQDDTAAGLLTLLKGFALGEDGKYYMTEAGKASLKEIVAEAIQSGEIRAEYLTVTKKAHFFELQVDEMKSTAGTLINTAANCVLEKVEARDSDGAAIADGDTATAIDHWRCWWRKEDSDGRAVKNQWAAGDQAIAYTCNLAEGATQDTGNSYWWRLVTAVGSEDTEIDGETVACHYIDVSHDDCDMSGGVGLTSGAPQSGDNVAQLGNRTDTTRQSATIFSAYDTPDTGVKSPSWAQYDGVDDYDLASHRYTWFARSGNHVRGDITLSSGEDVGGVISEMKQTAAGISLKVGSLPTDSKRWNLLDDAMANVVFYNNMDSWRTCKLKVGTTYTLTVAGRVLETGLTLRTYMYHRVADKYWVDGHIIDITAAADEVKSVTFAVPATFTTTETDPATTETYAEGDEVEYIVSPYIYDADGNTTLGSAQKALLRWAVVEAGATSSGEYTLSENDPLARANMVKGTGTLTGSSASGDMYMTYQNGSAGDTVELDGVKTKDYVATVMSDFTIMEYLNGGFAHEAKKVYTLSFWARVESGTGTVATYIAECDTLGSASSDGAARGEGYGETDFTIDTEWRRYWIAWVWDAAGTSTPYIRTQAAGTYHIAGVKLREGGRCDAWTDYGQSAQTQQALDLLPVGVDIDAGGITLTGDTKIQDRSGNVNTLFTTDESGSPVMKSQYVLADKVETGDGVRYAKLEGSTLEFGDGTTTFNFGFYDDGVNGRKFVMQVLENGVLKGYLDATGWHTITSQVVMLRCSGYHKISDTVLSNYDIVTQYFDTIEGGSAEDTDLWQYVAQRQTAGETVEIVADGTYTTDDTVAKAYDGKVFGADAAPLDEGDLCTGTFIVTGASPQIFYGDALDAQSYGYRDVYYEAAKKEVEWNETVQYKEVLFMEKGVWKDYKMYIFFN